MRILNQNVHPETFRRELADAPRRVLMLDYDGTLAPFVADRNNAYPYPGIRGLLEQIRTDTRNRLVIVTGRAVDNAIALLGMDPAPEIWGSHGYEHRRENGTYERHDVPDASLHALADATTRILNADLDDRLEKKPLSIAVHWRGMTPPAAEQINRQVRDLWESYINGGALELHAFDGGLELRIPGRTKGHAVIDIMQEQPADALYAYFGDDLTDEDAFTALHGKGLSVLVRDEHRDTRADILISPPDELIEWLTLWTL